MGILEQILAALNQIAANTAPVVGHAQAIQPTYQQPMQTYQPVQQPVQAAQTYQAPVGGAVVSVTAEQLQDLIMPHIDNPAIKDALGATMRANGVNALPEAPAEKYGLLYTAFQGVLAHFGVGGPAPVQQPVAQPTSII